MSKPLKPKRGTTAQHASFAGEPYEITVDTDKKTVVVHDGETVGGTPLAKEGSVSALDSTLRALIAQELAKKLGTGGGTMTGRLKIDGESRISGVDTSHALSIMGGTEYNNGAWLRLGGEDSDLPNCLILRIYQGTARVNYHEFLVKYDGVWFASEPLIVQAGTVVAFAGSSIPLGYLLCNGAAISRTTYADLFAAIGTIYGAGDGSTTFNLPNTIDKFIQGSTTAGTVKAAALPNISGDFDAESGSGYANTAGAFVVRSSASGKAYSSGGSHLIINFSARRNSDVYRDQCTTVQPPAVTMIPCIKY